MPSPVTATLWKPKSEDEFENIAADVLARWWSTHQVHRNGRRGQRQHGVDLYAMPAHRPGATLGAQCKNTASLTFDDVKKEVEEAEKFQPPLTDFWMVTSLERDARLQEEIRLMSEERRKRGAFPVDIWFWQDIEREICGNGPDGDLLVKYYGEWISRLLVDERRQLVDQLSRPVSALVSTSTPPSVDWSTFYAMPTGDGPASSSFLKLVATPKRAVELTIDGDLFEAFRDQVQREFAVLDPEHPPWTPRLDGVELMWRKPELRTARHWMRGQDGSVGFVTTIESTFKAGHVSLWEIALDCLMFVRFAGHLLVNEDIEFLIHFDPAGLVATADPLAPIDAPKGGLRGFPMVMKGPDPTSSNIGAVSEDFSARDVRLPFAKLGELLCHRWRRIFTLPQLSGRRLAEQLHALAVEELSWDAST